MKAVVNRLERDVNGTGETGGPPLQRWGTRIELR
jgi:hypothetical protein